MSAVSVVQQRLDDFGHLMAEIEIDRTQSVEEAVPIYRTDELTLDVADLVESGIGCCSNLDVQ